MERRYSTAGLAHGAADLLSEATGTDHVVAFRPRTRSHPDPNPFAVEPQPSPNEGWIGGTVQGELRVTRLQRVAEIWRDQGMAVLPLPCTVGDLHQAIASLAERRG